LLGDRTEWVKASNGASETRLDKGEATKSMYNMLNLPLFLVKLMILWIYNKPIKRSDQAKEDTPSGMFFSGATTKSLTV